MDADESNGHQNEPRRHIEQTPAPVERPHATVNNTASGKHGNQKEKHWPQRVEAVCAVLLVIITGCYTYFAAGQLHKMTRATKAAENAAVNASNANVLAKQGIEQALDSSRIDQRAWIDIFAGAPKAFDPNQPFRVPVNVKNVGRTPAKNIRFGYFFRSVPKATKIEFEQEPPLAQPGALPPNGILLLELSPDQQKPDAPLTQPRFDVIKSGKYLVYFWGIERYDDAFGYSHWVKFCYIFNVPHVKFDLCSVHNDIDPENR